MWKRLGGDESSAQPDYPGQRRRDLCLRGRGGTEHVNKSLQGAVCAKACSIKRNTRRRQTRNSLAIAAAAIYETDATPQRAEKHFRCARRQKLVQTVGNFTTATTKGKKSRRKKFWGARPPKMSERVSPGCRPTHAATTIVDDNDGAKDSEWKPPSHSLLKTKTLAKNKPQQTKRAARDVVSQTMPAAHRQDTKRTADHHAIIARGKKALQKQPKLDSVAIITQTKTHQHVALEKAGMMLTMRRATSASCLTTTTCWVGKAECNNNPTPPLINLGASLQIAGLQFAKKSDCSLHNIPSTKI